MEKERRIKTISVIALIVAVLGLTVAFAVLSANLVINGTAKVEAGTWNIYFANLSSANLKGGATVEGTATINDENKTKIQDMNIILTKPMDEVTYTVELKNDGDIDAEISSINEPNLNADQQKYVEFSAIYNSDKKPITEGDILRGGATENVTISIKFKKEVTQLPGESLNIPLSYEINYVQSDKSKDEEVHKGQVSTPQIDYDSLDVGSTVNLGEEEFYVIENSANELKLLAKYNLLVGNNVVFEDLQENGEPNNDPIVTPIDSNTPGYGRQSSKAITYVIDNDNSAGILKWVGAMEFSNNREYWKDESGNLKSNYGSKYPAYVYDSNSSPYNIIENYKHYLESLNYNIKEVRLMSFEEAEKLGCDIEKQNCEASSDFVYSMSYMLGSVSDDGEVYSIINYDSYFATMDVSINYAVGIRPVIVIDKTE